MTALNLIGLFAVCGLACWVVYDVLLRDYFNPRRAAPSPPNVRKRNTLAELPVMRRERFAGSGLRDAVKSERAVTVEFPKRMLLTGGRS